MSKLRSLIKENRGQGLVEFALVLPILLAVVFGIIDFGRLFYCWSTLSNASRHGARLAAVSNLDYDEIATDVYNSVVLDGVFLGSLSEDDVEISDDGNDVTCTVSGSVDLWVLQSAFKLLGSETTPKGNFPVTGKTVMRLE